MWSIEKLFCHLKKTTGQYFIKDRLTFAGSAILRLEIFKAHSNFNNKLIHSPVYGNMVALCPGRALYLLHMLTIYCPGDYRINIVR